MTTLLERNLPHIISALEAAKSAIEDANTVVDKDEEDVLLPYENALLEVLRALALLKPDEYLRQWTSLRQEIENARQAEEREADAEEDDE